MLLDKVKGFHPRAATLDMHHSFSSHTHTRGHTSHTHLETGQEPFIKLCVQEEMLSS